MCAMMQKLRVCSIPMKRGNYAGAAKVAQGWGSFFDRGQTLLPESGSGFVEWHTCQRRNVRSRSAIAAGLSRAKGAVSYQPGASPQDLGPHRKQALKARLNDSRSIPHLLLVELNLGSAQQFTVFLLKSAAAMVFFLFLDVLQHSFESALAHGKTSHPRCQKKPQ